MTSLSLFTFTHWRRKWQPTPEFLPEEAQAETAKRYGEKPCMSDEELLPLVFKHCREFHKVANVSELDNTGQKELALWLKNEYAASNNARFRHEKK